MIRTAQAKWGLTPDCEVCDTLVSLDPRGNQMTMVCRCGLTAWYHHAHHPHGGIHSECSEFRPHPQKLIESLRRVVESLEG